LGLLHHGGVHLGVMDLSMKVDAQRAVVGSQIAAQTKEEEVQLAKGDEDDKELREGAIDRPGAGDDIVGRRLVRYILVLGILQKGHEQQARKRKIKKEQPHAGPAQSLGRVAPSCRL